MSLLRRVRGLYDHGHGTTSQGGEGEHSALARVVIQATSPEASAPAPALLSELARSVNSRNRAADTDAAVRALSSRLSDRLPRAQLHALAVTDHLLRSVNEPRAASNFRSVTTQLLLPKIRNIATGRPPAAGESKPVDQVRADALRRLEDWAAPNFMSGALSRHPLFADAYRDAAVHTPSPPPPQCSASAAADVLASHPSPVSQADDPPLTVSRIGPLPRASPPNGADSIVSVSRDPAVAGNLEAPNEDGLFLEYYAKRISSFDTLHILNKVPLSDKRVRNLRVFMETHLERLRRMTASSVNAHQKDAMMFAKLADHRLKKFSDYRPRPTEGGSASPSTSLAIPPPSYPPPSVVRVPYERDASDVVSSIKSDAAASADLARQPMHPPKEPSCTPTTLAQQRLLRSVAAAFGRPPSAPADAPYLAVMPTDLSPAATRVSDAHTAPVQQAPAQPSMQRPPHTIQLASMPGMGRPPYYRPVQQQQMYSQLPHLQLPVTLLQPPQHPAPQQHPHAHPYHQYATYPGSLM